MYRAALFLSFLCICPIAALGVEVPDPNLRSGLEQALGLNPGDPITQEDMQSLTSLRIDDAGVMDLTGLEFAVNLDSLFLDGNSISDITPLATLTNLTRLYLFDNQISDITPLGSLMNLSVLYLDRNQISDISALASLTKLTRLYLQDNLISNISPLVNLTELQILRLFTNQISDLGPLAGLTKLTRLDLQDNLISEISPLANLTELQELGLSSNQVSNIGALATLTNLTRLFLFDNQISDISPLTPLTNLTGHYLGNNQISDITPISSFTNVTTLLLFGNQISDITPLANLQSLRFLRLDSNLIQSTAGMETLTSLVEVNLSSNQITDISALASLGPESAPDLRLIWLNDNFIEDVTPLSGLNQLRNVSFPTIAYYEPDPGNAPGLRLEYNGLDISDNSAARAVIDALNAIDGLDVLFEEYAPLLRINRGNVSLLGEPGGSYLETIPLSNWGTGSLQYEILFSPEVSWLSASPQSGTIAEQESANINLNVTDLPEFEGSIEVELIINTNEQSGSSQSLQVIVVREFPKPDYSGYPGDFQIFEAGPNFRTEVRDGGANGRQLVGTYLTDNDEWVPYVWDPVNGVQDAPYLPGAIIPGPFSFNMLQSISAEAQLAVGRTFDEFGNLVPVVWSLKEPLSPPTILPFPDGLDRTAFSDRTLGRAFAIAEDGFRISGQAVNGDGFLEGIIWKWDENASVWTIERRTGGFDVLGANFLEVWPYEMSGSGDTAIGFVQYFDADFQFVNFHFYWTAGSIDFLPAPADAESPESDLISFDGRTIYGQYYDPDLDGFRLIVWKGDPASGNWSFDTFAYPEGFRFADLESFINRQSDVVSMSLMLEGNTGWRSYLFSPSMGFVPSREWILDNFGLDMGSEWEGDLHYANPATGFLFGKMSPYVSNEFQWVGFRYDRFGGIQNSISEAPFMTDLPPDRQGPLDTNGPLEIQNLLAYGLGVHPLYTTEEDLPQAQVDVVDGEVFAGLTSNYNEMAQDIDVIAEVSSSLAGGNWSQDPQNLEIIRDGNGNLTVRDKVPASPENPRFIRLRVVPKP
jgi:internalin A